MTGYKKVSLMDHITSAPDDSIIYIVKADGSYGYITKAEFLAGISGGSGNLQGVTTGAGNNETTNPIIWTNGANKRIELGFFEGAQGLFFYDTDIDTNPISYISVNSDGTFNFGNGQTDVNQNGAVFYVGNIQGTYRGDGTELFDNSTQKLSRLKVDKLSFKKTDSNKQIDFIQDFTVSGAGLTEIVVRYKGAAASETLAFISDITATNANALQRDGSNANSNIDIGTNEFSAVKVSSKNADNSKYVALDQSDGVQIQTNQYKGVIASDDLLSDTKFQLPENGGAGGALATAASVIAAEASAKSYADGLVVGLWDDRGNFNASVNAYPSSGGSGTAGAIKKGDTWTVSVAGTLPTSQVVEVGDIVRALVDAPGNTQSNWAIQQNNIGYTAENSAYKANSMTGSETSTSVYLSAKGLYDWATGLFWQAVDATSSVKGIMKLFTATGSNTDGAMTQKATTDALDLKADKLMGAYKFRVNNTNASANATETNFKQLPKATYSGTPTFTAGTAPSGATDHSCSGQHIGEMMYGKIDLNYGSAGSTVQQVVIPLPSDWPTPVKPNGFTAASERIAIGVGFTSNNTTGVTQALFSCILRANSANTGFEIVISQASSSSRYFHLTINYPTA